MGTIARRTLDGDTTVAEWSPDDPTSIAAASEVLRREAAAGYMAVRADGDTNEPVDDLPVDAELVVLTMPMGGG